MPAELYRDQLARYAQLLNIGASRLEEAPGVLQLTIQRLPAPILVSAGQRPNPLLGEAMRLLVTQFAIDIALTAGMVRTFVERSRDVTTCWGVAVDVRDAPAAMTNLEPRAQYRASLRMVIPGQCVDLETFAWVINQMVCAYVDLMGVRAQHKR